MASPQFDRIVIIDWSAANQPKTGADSIWIADSHRPTVNWPTRAQAIRAVQMIIDESLKQTNRLLIGWDFAFGYPKGFAAELGVRSWQGIWAWLHSHIHDAPTNRSNRFEVAARLNQRFGPSPGPFWGFVGRTCPAGLHPKRYPHGKTKDQWLYPFQYERCAEQQAQGAKSVFQIAYSGSVGSQSLLGIAHLEDLRRRYNPQIGIWPFETQFTEGLFAPITFAEIYPSAHSVPKGTTVKDQRQVEAVLRDCLDWNGTGQMTHQLSGPAPNSFEREAALTEEGWILGL